MILLAKHSNICRHDPHGYWSVSIFYEKYNFIFGSHEALTNGILFPVKLLNQFKYMLLLGCQFSKLSFPFEN